MSDISPPPSSALRVLLVEDDEDDYVLTRGLLASIDSVKVELSWAPGYDEGLALVRARSFDVVLLDYRLGRHTGLDFLGRLPLEGVPPVILLTGQQSDGTDVQAMRLGAADYLSKDGLNSTMLERAIRYAVERYQAQMARSDAERSYELLVDSVGAIVWRCDPVSLGITFVNRAAEEMLGYPVSRWTAEPSFWTRHIHEEDRKLAAAACAAAAAERSPQTFNCRMTAADGGVVWLRTTVRAVSRSGQLELAGVMVDITAIKEAEEKLRLLDRALAAVGEGILITDAGQEDDPIIYVNPAFERITGYGAGEVLGRNCRFLQGEGTRPRDIAALRAAVKSRHPRSGEILNYRSDGTPFWNRLSIVPIRNDAGQVTHFVGVQRDVTRQRAAREELEASHTLLRTIIDGTPDAVFAKDVHGRYLLVNRAAAEILGRDPGEVIGRTDEELLGAESGEVFREADLRVIASGEPHVTEESAATSVGMRTYHALKSPIRGPDGQVRGVVGISRDITERREMEEALRRSNELFELVLRATNDVIWDWDVVSQTVRWSEGITRTFGYPPPETTSLEWWGDRVHPDDAERVLRTLHQALEDTGVWAQEYRYRRADGSYVVVLDRGQVLHDANGAPIRMIGSMQDITERQRLVAALEQSEAHYRRLVSRAPQAIYAVDSAGRFAEANPAAAELLQRPLEEVVGLDFLAVIASEDQARALELFEGIMSGRQETAQSELRIVRPSGEKRQVFIDGVPIRDDAGQVIGGHGLARDITEEREQDQRVRRAERLATVGTLVGGVAHELNNPLAAVVGLTGLLLMDDQPAALRADLETIQREAKRMGEIVANLRRLSRDSAASTRAREAVDLNDVVRHILRTRSYSLRTQNVEVREDLDPALPAVLADRGQLEQVVLNLVVNAEQAMHGRPGSVLIVRTRRGIGGVSIHVVDNGGGMDNAVLQRIFDPFFTTKKPGEGTGLGLSLVHNMVAEHGGDIQVDSTLDSGTTFRIDLPALTEVGEHSREVAEGGSQAPPAPLRVLVVDDEDAVRSVIARYLRRRGHAVDEAADGAEALRLIEAASAPHEVIISDLRMPGVGGAEFLSHLRARGDGIAHRLVFLTGDTAREDLDAAAADMDVPVLTKPIELEALGRWVEQRAR